MSYLSADKGTAAAFRSVTRHPLVTLLVAGVLFYIAWLLAQSAPQFLQFSINGIVIGAIYALMALGFTMVYGTVWFFDLSYGAMATMGAYTVFYFTASEVQTVGRGEVNNIYLNVVIGVLIAGVASWVLYTWLYSRLRGRVSRGLLLAVVGLLSLSVGAYTGLIMSRPADLNVFLSPVIGALVAAATIWTIYRSLYADRGRQTWLGLLVALGSVGALALGAYCGLLVAKTSGTVLYLSWAMGALFGGATGLALYRGIYFYMRRRARSPLVMLVGSLGILLAMTAFISIIFSPDGRPLAPPFGTDAWSLGGARIKPFQVFFIGVTFVIFTTLVIVLKKTSFGKALRAISDDEEVARVVGINTTVNIAAVFFIGAAIAALGGIFIGEDIGIRPPTALFLLLKGWVASVVGGIGNIYGALLGGFVLGLVENFGVWYVSSEWKDAFAFVLLIFFLTFWPRGLLPRK